MCSRMPVPRHRSDESGTEVPHAKKKVLTR